MYINLHIIVYSYNKKDYKSNICIPNKVIPDLTASWHY